MDGRLSILAKAAKASMRGEEIDPHWIYEKSLEVLDQLDSFQTNTIWHTLVESACALNDTGEFALGGEIFEALLECTRERKCSKIEFDVLEGLAESWFYLGDRDRAFDYLDHGLALATELNRKHTIERFQGTIARYREGGRVLPGARIKAPTNVSAMRRKRRSHVSSLLKKERNR